MQMLSVLIVLKLADLSSITLLFTMSRKSKFYFSLIAVPLNFLEVLFPCQTKCFYFHFLYFLHFHRTEQWFSARVDFAPPSHLPGGVVMSRDIFDCHDQGSCAMSGGQQPELPLNTSITRNYLTQNVNNAQVAKPCCRLGVRVKKNLILPKYHS